MVIRQLGVYDHDLETHHATFGRPTSDHQRGVAYPSVFVLDETGLVIQKRHQENYRSRESGASLLEEAFGRAARQSEPSQPRRDQVVAVSVRLDSPAYGRYERLRVIADLDIAPGWHIYGEPIAEGYSPLRVDLEPSAELEIGRQVMPQTHPFRVQGIDEDFHVYEGRVRATRQFSFRVDPGHGDERIRVRITYQACSLTECLPPAELIVELPVPAEIPMEPQS